MAPLTRKKPGKKYRGGITIDNRKYQNSPSYDHAFIYVRKIQEIDKRKICHQRRKQVDQYGNTLLDSTGKELFKKEYVKIYQLDSIDFDLLRDKCKEVIKFNW